MTRHTDYFRSSVSNSHIVFSQCPVYLGEEELGRGAGEVSPKQDIKKFQVEEGNSLTGRQINQEDFLWLWLRRETKTDKTFPCHSVSFADCTHTHRKIPASRKNTCSNPVPAGVVCAPAGNSRAVSTAGSRPALRTTQRAPGRGKRPRQMRPG